MSWTLTVVSGTRRGDTFPLRDGLTIGRKRADVALDDARVSGLHARVATSANGFELTDNGSKNGLKDGRGQMVERIQLKPGVLFTVGETTFRVDGGAAEAPTVAVAVVKPPRSGAPAPAAAPTAVTSRPSPPRRSWSDVLAEVLVEHVARFRDKPRALIPLEPALVLSFQRGPQINAKWILGFGPRRVGPGALDLPIWEPDVPPICFEILPGRDGLVFRTEHRELVRLNGRPVDNDVLRRGDVIQIRGTIIQVDFTA